MTTQPRVAVIWLNYNGDRMMDISKESLSAIKQLKYDNLELIIVDNASTDGSLDRIIEHVDSIGLKATILKSQENLGFTGGNNLAYSHLRQDTRYVALINSDLIPSPCSLKKLVEKMEADGTIGALQGIILNNEGSAVDSSGAYLDEALRSYQSIQGRFHKRRPITYADGCYCLIRTNAIKDIQDGYIFDQELFAYFEDALLGIKMWNRGYRVELSPYVSGRHVRGRSSKSLFKLYQNIRNRTALGFVVKTGIGRLYFYRTLLLGLLYSLPCSALRSDKTLRTSLYIRAFLEGRRVGERLRMKGMDLSLMKVPHIRLGVFKAILVPRRRTKITLKEIVL